MTVDIKALIAKQKALLETPTTDTVNVHLAGELVAVEVARLLPVAWQELTGANPPRKNNAADTNVGYNQNGVPRGYPVDHLKVDGQDIDQETWSDLFDSLDVTNRHNVHTVMWGTNVYAGVSQLRALGKARADQQSASQGNRASRRGGSKAGSPPKSRRSSTTTTGD